MISSKLKTISDIETNLLYSEAPILKNWYECEDDITEYKDFFFDVFNFIAFLTFLMLIFI